MYDAGILSQTDPVRFLMTLSNRPRDSADLYDQRTGEVRMVNAPIERQKNKILDVFLRGMDDTRRLYRAHVVNDALRLLPALVVWPYVLLTRPSITVNVLALEFFGVRFRPPPYDPELAHGWLALYATDTHAVLWNHEVGTLVARRTTSQPMQPGLPLLPYRTDLNLPLDVEILWQLIRGFCEKFRSQLDDEPPVRSFVCRSGRRRRHWRGRRPDASSGGT